MPSNYDVIRAENIREYGEGTRHLAFLGRLYSDRTHFIFELLQNAEDARATKILFHLFEDRLEVLHNGRPFNAGKKDDVRGICGVGKGTKTEDLTQIGKFGIGFKSVYAYTATPEIHSDDEHFRIEHYVRPCPAAPREPGNGWTTLFVFGFDAPDLKPEIARDEIARRLQNMRARTLLFLRNIADIKYRLPDESGGSYRRKKLKRSPARQVAVIGQNNGQKEDERWLIFERRVLTPNGSAWVRVEIAFRLATAAEGGSQRIVKVQDSPLVVYFPTEKQTRFGFLVQGPYRTTPARDNIPQDDDWNALLIGETAILITEALENLRDMGLLTVSLLEALPIRTEDFPQDGMFYPIAEAVHGALKEHELLPADDGTSASAKNGRLAHSAELRKLLTDRQLRAVWQTSDGIKWLSGEITQDRTPDLRSFLINQLGVAEVTLEEFVQRLSADSLKDMDDEWFVGLYRYLRSHVPPAEAQRLGLIKRAIVPATNDRQGTRRLSCAEEQPIYFSGTSTDHTVLADIPDWLTELAPIAFLDAEFLCLLDSQPDRDALRKWLADVLHIRDFSVGTYCDDVLRRLCETYPTLEVDQIVAATDFLAHHAGERLDWERLPVILSDGRKMLLREARKLTYRSSSNTWPYYHEQTVQAIVVPEGYDIESGWPSIWQSPEDRRHFVWLSNAYKEVSLKRLVKTGLIKEYPLPERTIEMHERRTVTEVTEDYRSPKTTPTKHEALTKWLLIHADAKPEWPEGTYRSDFSGERHDVGWALKKTYYRQYGEPYSVKTGTYQFCCAHSSFLEWLRNNPWLPSTKGLVRPSQAFLPKDGTKDRFGDAVPYYEGDLPEKTLNLLGVRSALAVDNLLDLLQEQSANTAPNPDMVELIYTQLAAMPKHTLWKFPFYALILVKDGDGSPRWCKSGDCVWADASAVLGDKFAYLQKQYPKLQDFFIEKLDVRRRVDPESFAQRWLELQEAPVADLDRQRTLIERLYGEIKPTAQSPEASRPKWWSDFSRKVKVYTKADTFEPPGKVVLPDDGLYRDMFQGDVPFAWRPEKEGFDEWASLYRALGTPLLSETVTEDLGDDGVDHELLPHNQFVTEAAVQMIAAWLREKQRGDYDRLLKNDGFAQLAAVREAKTSSGISVEFRLTVGTDVRTRIRTYPVFWKRTENILIYSENAPKSDIAKVIAKGLLDNRAYRDLADWVELVLEEHDVDRIRRADWSVPQPILNLLSRNTSTVAAPKTPQIPDSKTTPTESGAEVTESNVVQPVQEAPHAEPAPDQPSDPTGASKDDVQGRTIGPSSSGGDAGQGVPGWPRRTEQPHHVKPPDLEPATDHHDRSQVSKQDDSFAVTDLAFAASLRAAFDRPGCTKFDDADEAEADDLEDATVKNPQRRRERLAARYRESINDEPEPNERRRVTEYSLLEGPNEAVRVSLDEWYHGKCQICGETWPRQDGEPYFTAAYLVERRHARWLDDPGNAICLCAEHFAQWRHAAKEMPLDVIEQIRSLRLRAEGGDGNLSIEFTLLGEDVAITYDEPHLLALRTLVEVVGKGH